MEILSLIGTVLNMNQFLVLMLFLTFIFMLFRGIPVAFALVGVGLLFGILGEFVLDPNAKAISQYIDFDRTRITYKKLFAISGRFFGGVIKTQFLSRCRCLSLWA